MTSLTILIPSYDTAPPISTRAANQRSSHDAYSNSSLFEYKSARRARTRTLSVGNQDLAAVGDVAAAAAAAAAFSDAGSSRPKQRSPHRHDRYQPRHRRTGSGRYDGGSGGLLTGYTSATAAPTAFGSLTRSDSLRSGRSRRGGGSMRGMPRRVAFEEVKPFAVFTKVCTCRVQYFMLQCFETNEKRCDVIVIALLFS